MRSAGFALLLAALLFPLLGSQAAWADDDKKMASHKITQLESYVTVEPIYATVIDLDRPVGLLLVAIGLNIPDAELRAQAVHTMPLLRDAYLRNMVTFAASAVRPWKQPDVNIIASRLQHVTDRTLRKSGAQVLLSQVVVRITK